jgi:hypothetical protein
LTWNGLPLGGGLEYTGTVTLADGTLGVTIRPDPADITGHSWCLDSTGCDTTTCFHTTDFSCSPVYMHFTPSLNVACCGDSGSTFLVVTG